VTEDALFVSGLHGLRCEGGSCRPPPSPFAAVRSHLRLQIFLI
jgi:hypothetical protein